MFPCWHSLEIEHWEVSLSGVMSRTFMFSNTLSLNILTLISLSGSVMVVLKMPSQENLPHMCQLLCLFAVWGRKQGIMVSLCLSSASQECFLSLVDKEQLQTPTDPSTFL